MTRLGRLKKRKLDSGSSRTEPFELRVDSSKAEREKRNREFAARRKVGFKRGKS